MRARCFHVSLSQAKLVNITGQQPVRNIPTPTKRVWRTIIYVSGLGVVSGGSYYLLVNGPSRAAPTSSKIPMAPAHFTPVTVTSSVPSTPYTKLLKFKLQPETIPKHMPGGETIYSIYVKDSDIQVERPYTPLEGVNKDGEMMFWVKRYQGGEVGRWIHERKVGDEIEIRGPVITWQWREGEEWDEIIMISGGTGITPFYQFMHTVFSEGRQNRSKQTRFTLLHSSPSVSELPPGIILDGLREKSAREPNLFRMQIYVDVLDKKLEGVHVGRINGAVIENLFRISKPNLWKHWWRRNSNEDLRDEIHIDETKRILFLICGPQPMMIAMKEILTRKGRRVHKL